MNPILKYLYNLKTKNINYINGYSSFIALFCLSLLLQLVTCICAYSQEKAYLFASQKQSHLDLAIIDAAKTIISHNQYVRRCHRKESELIIKKRVLIKDQMVEFQDETTILHAYINQLHYKFYYDVHYILHIDIEFE